MAERTDTNQPARPHTPPWALLVTIGLLAGATAGLFGVGGGMVVVPALMALCRRGHRQAVATSLLAMGPLATAGFVGYALHREVDVWFAVPLVAGSMLGAWLGVALLRRVSQRALRFAFTAAVLLAAVRLLLDPGVPGGEPERGLALLAILLPVGLLVGVLAGMTGIGGGAVMVPVLQLGFGASAALAKGTSLLVILPTALFGSWRGRRAALGSVRDASWIAGTGVVAALALAAVSVRLPGTTADIMFGCFLLLVALRTSWVDLRAAAGWLRRR